MQQFQNNSIFWVAIEKIRPNPYQPRRDFDGTRLNDLAESIRQYGVLQPLVVTRYELVKDDGGIVVGYELIAGERRLRASKIAGILQVPVIIRDGEESDRMKLELAIIENLQREDLNPVDRARAFDRLVNEFGFNHTQVARKISRSREYVSNSIRILMLPDEMTQALSEGKINEGHTRPLLMLSDRKEEQNTLFKEIVYRQITVREAEAIARKIATDRVRKNHEAFNPEILELESNLSESLGTRVHIEPRDIGGKIVIDYFSPEDLRVISDIIRENRVRQNPNALLDKYLEEQERAEDAKATATGYSGASDPESAGAIRTVSVPDDTRTTFEAITVAEKDAPLPYSPAPTQAGEDRKEPESPLAPEALSNPVETTGVESLEEGDGDIYSVRHFSI